MAPFQRREQALSPRLALNWQLSNRWSFNSSAYRGFRAPTLNELYRTFRVGNVQTLANEDLTSERVTGYELGALASSLSSSLRINLFWMDLSDPVANVTIATTPSLITRQRENLGGTRSRGVEIDFERRLASALTFSGGYLLADSRVVSFPANSELEGKLVPQVARQQLTMQLRASMHSLSGSLQGRWSDSQFEDDRNQLRLRSYFTADAIAALTIRSWITGYLAIENLFDERYEIGRTPVVTLAPPRSVRAGVRLTAR